MRIFEEDQAAAAQFADLEDAREQLLAQVAGAEPEDSMLDATIPDGLQDLLGDEADELSNRIDALEQQLAALAALQEVEGAEPYTECEVYEEVLSELTADLEQEADALLATLGDSNNEMSMANFFGSGSFVELQPEDLALPADMLPAKPDDCDAEHAEDKYGPAATSLGIATQFVAWCNANPGDVMADLCGPLP